MSKGAGTVTRWIPSDDRPGVVSRCASERMRIRRARQGSSQRCPSFAAMPPWSLRVFSSSEPAASAVVSKEGGGGGGGGGATTSWCLTVGATRSSSDAPAVTAGRGGAAALVVLAGVAGVDAARVMVVERTRRWMRRGTMRR